MTVRVMLVDDSAVIRGLITRALTADPYIEVIATASNGQMAVDMVALHKPDVIILDIEMPVMDGITALPRLLREWPQGKIIVASTLSVRNAAISLQAMELGAADYLAKPSARDTEQLALFYRELTDKVKALGGVSARTAKTPVVAQAPLPSPRPSTPISLSNASAPIPPVRAIAIASSTGGPQALQAILEQMKGQLTHLPIYITQHMPPTFTTLLAEHLGKASGRPCAEAKEGESAKAGHVYLAPGNYHMTAEKKGVDVLLHLNQDPPENFCRPAADPMLRSLASIYGSGLLLAVLTGMGQDGLEGAKVVVAQGGNVIAQDEATSVVWGMPKAVAESGICRAVLPLPEIAPYLIKACSHARI